MRQRVWLSYDLGMEGDYPSLYAWLDDHQARECGDHMATFQYEYRNDVVAELKEDLCGAVELGRTARLYLIYLDAAGKPRGKFLAGRRRPAPWGGFAEEYEVGIGGES